MKRPDPDRDARAGVRRPRRRRYALWSGYQVCLHISELIPINGMDFCVQRRGRRESDIQFRWRSWPRDPDPDSPFHSSPN
ncbi:hypothetical protein DAI22_03g092501 [Oryza sativa Japonica Group]|jgi:hypothetical protein|nr:hypothetical protein DAI22_03g092501 [Oryza sativa Japonica Group]